jgi:actin related protein 2/3 complex subunit 5
MDTNFRKIDIDQFDEDVLLEEELYEADARAPAQVLEDARQKQSAVRSALSKCVHGTHSKVGQCI